MHSRTAELKDNDIFFPDVYHSTFDPPTDAAVVQRLVPDPKSSEKVMIERLMEYHR